MGAKRCGGVSSFVSRSTKGARWAPSWVAIGVLRRKYLPS